MSSTIDPVLSTLTIAQLQLVEDQLTNNEVASDDELHSYLHDNGLTVEQASQALQYRDRYLRNLYFSGQTPILKGDDALAFNPRTFGFEQSNGVHERPSRRKKAR